MSKNIDDIGSFNKLEYDKNWKKNNPWMASYHMAKQRCNNPKSTKYKWYGGKGIKFLITKDDFKILWFRDKAYELKIPSIDRIDSNGNYTYENCRFIELEANRSRAKKGKYPFCKRGHPFNETTSRISPTHGRICLVCKYMQRKHPKSRPLLYAKEYLAYASIYIKEAA